MVFRFASAPLRVRKKAKTERVGWNLHAQHRELKRLTAANNELQRQVTQLQLDNVALAQQNRAFETLLHNLAYGSDSRKTKMARDDVAGDTAERIVLINQPNDA